MWKTHLNNPQRILILQTAFIGDVILATPLIEGAKRNWPGVEVSFLTIPYSAPVLKHHPGLQEVFVFDKRGAWKESWRAVRWMQERKFDLAIIPHRSLRSALLVTAAGIKNKIGFNRSAGWFMLSNRVKYRREWHEVKRNLSLIGLDKEDIAPKIYPGEMEISKAETFLTQNHIAETFLSIAPGSIWNTKKWPEEYYHDLCVILKGKDYPQVVLIGGPQEAEICKRVADGLEGFAVTAAGELNPLESAALIQRAQLMICNDSAAGHIASAVGTNVISIFGPTVPAFGFAPYGNDNIVIEHPDLYCRPCRIHGSEKCPEKHFKCMEEIDPEDVLTTISVI